MRKFFYILIYILQLLTTSCKKTPIHYSFNNHSKNIQSTTHISSRDDNGIAGTEIYVEENNNIEVSADLGKKPTIIKDKSFSRVEIYSKNYKKQLPDEKEIIKDSKKKKGDKLFVFWIIFFVLLTAAIAGLFYLLFLIFPDLGLTKRRVILYILGFYALIFLLVWGGKMPKTYQPIIEPVKPCQEIDCTSFGCENGTIYTTQGDVKCIRCNGTGKLCK